MYWNDYNFFADEKEILINYNMRCIETFVWDNLPIEIEDKLQHEMYWNSSNADLNSSSV